jgi:hypothetical protein
MTMSQCRAHSSIWRNAVRGRHSRPPKETVARQIDKRTGQLGLHLAGPLHRLGTGLVKPADALSTYQSDAQASNQQLVIESELRVVVSRYFRNRVAIW